MAYLSLLLSVVLIITSSISGTSQLQLPSAVNRPAVLDPKTNTLLYLESGTYSIFYKPRPDDPYVKLFGFTAPGLRSPTSISAKDSVTVYLKMSANAKITDYNIVVVKLRPEQTKNQREAILGIKDFDLLFEPEESIPHRSRMVASDTASITITCAPAQELAFFFGPIRDGMPLYRMMCMGTNP